MAMANVENEKKKKINLEERWSNFFVMMHTHATGDTDLNVASLR